MKTVLRQITKLQPAISKSQAKAHLDVTHDDDDTRIQEIVEEATRYVSNITRSPIRPAMYRMQFETWPTECIELPRWPLDAESVKVEYYAAGDTPDDPPVLTEYDGYEALARDREPGEIRLKPGETPPDHVQLWYPVMVTFNAGTEEFDVSFRRAVKLLVRHWYDQPAPVVVGTISTEIERSLASLIRMLKPGGVSAAPDTGGY